MTILTQSQRDDIQAEHDEMVEYARTNNYGLDRNQTIRGALLASENALRERLELTPECMGHDGIYCRDETIRLQGNIIAKLKERLERVQRIKPFVLADDQTFVIHYDELEQALEQDE